MTEEMNNKVMVGMKRSAPGMPTLVLKSLSKPTQDRDGYVLTSSPTRATGQVGLESTRIRITVLITSVAYSSAAVVVEGLTRCLIRAWMDVVVVVCPQRMVSGAPIMVATITP